MASPVPDEVFARQLNQMGLVTVDQIETAMREVVASKQTAEPKTLADILVSQGLITQSIQVNVERKSLAAQQGGVKQLGHYKLLKKLGEGGMGAVFLADDTAVGRKVALKVLPKKYASDGSFLARFRREAKATGQLNHVNIVSAYTTGEDLGYHYYAMEFCDGEPLDAILKRQKMLDWGKAIEITLQVARGLKHAHEHNLIHRDIKPANIFMTKDGIAKILDLGLSKNIDDSEQSFNTQTGVALGTPHYISPEQARGDKGIDGRTDIYSLGAMLYHLLTGETPFHGSTSAMIMMKHLTAQLPNPQDLNENIPDGVVHVLRRMMAKEPDDRYKDCGDLLKDLELVLDGKTPSSQKLDDGKSSIAGRQGLAPARRTTRGNQKIATKKVDPVAQEHRTGESARLRQEKKPPMNWALYGGIGGGALVMVLVGVFAFGGGKKKEEEVSKPSLPSPPPAVAKVENPPAAATQKAPEVSGVAGLDEAWVKSVQGLPAEELAKRVKEEMKRLNPGLIPDCTIRIENARITQFEVIADRIQTLAPVSVLKDLNRFVCHGNSNQTNAPLKSIAALKGLKLKYVDVEGTSVSDLSPLQGMPLDFLSIRRAPVTDLSTLRTLPLKSLITEDLKVDSLAALEGWSLTQLVLSKSHVTDFSALKSLRQLNELNLQNSQVTSLEPLRYSNVASLNITGCKITDLYSLRDLPKLSTLVMDFDLKRDLDLLRSLRSLAYINRVNKDEFFAKAAMCDPAKKDGAWTNAVDLLPLINPALDRVSGSSWTVGDGNVAGNSAHEPFASIGIPYRVPEEYDFRGVITRTSEGGNAFIMVPFGTNYYRLRLTNSLSLGDTPQMLKSNRAAIQWISHECVIKVRKGGTQIYFDDELLFDANAAQLQTLIMSGNTFSRDSGRLGLMIDSGAVAQFNRLQVREVTGRGVFVRPSDPAAVAAEKARGGTPTSAVAVGVDDAWVKSVQAMTPENQIIAVSKKLQELNPGFDGKMMGRDGNFSPSGSPRIDNGVVTELGFFSDDVTDLSPVMALKGLKVLSAFGSNWRIWAKLADLSPLNGMNTLTALNVSNTQVSDLSVVKGMPLTWIAFGATNVSSLEPLRGKRLTGILCSSTRVTDLSPLAGMPLTNLSFHHTHVTEMSAIKGMPLKDLNMYGTDVSDLTPLLGMNLEKLLLTPKNITQGIDAIRQMKSLKSLIVENKPYSPEEFWAKYDAGEFGSAKPAEAKPEPAEAPDDPARWKNSLNLISMLDLKKDTVTGNWKIENGELVSEKGNSLRVQFPYSPPAEYDYRVEYTIKSGDLDVTSVIFAGGKEFCFKNGARNQPNLCAFDEVKGKHFTNNETTTTMPFSLKVGERTVSIIQVRKDNISAHINGKLVLSRKTDYSEFNQPKDKALRDLGCLGVVSWGCVTTFHSVKLLEVSGKGKNTRN